MTSFRFSAPEYHHHHKNADWYWTVGIIALATAATSIILGNIIFSILIIVSTVALFIHSSKLPLENEIEINDVGVTIDKYRFYYSNLQSFWLELRGKPKLLIKTNKTFLPHIIIPVSDLDDDERDAIRDFLSTKLPEVEQSEPLGELIMEYFGF